ncbi:hypothetical protein MRX96_007073 [Rhipicephalus microplus]
MARTGALRREAGQHRALPLSLHAYAAHLVSLRELGEKYERPIRAENAARTQSGAKNARPPDLGHFGEWRASESRKHGAPRSSFVRAAWVLRPNEAKAATTSETEKRAGSVERVVLFL